MGDILAALVPVFLVIALGAVMRRAGFPGAAFWPLLERVTYFIIFPCFLFATLVRGELGDHDIGPMALALLGGILAMAGLVATTRPFFGFSGPQYSSVFQGAVRWNGFVALAAIGTLYGADGLALAAVGFAVLVPVANLLSVYVVTRAAQEAPVPLPDLALALAGNPLLLACAAGIAVNGLGLTVPGPLFQTAAMIGASAVPLGLLAVGASLDLGAARTSLTPLAYTSVLRLVVMPVLMFASCTVFGVEGVARAVAVICGATPTATSAYILARQLGGDAVLMANLITATTFGAALSLPVVIALLQA